MDDLIHLTTGQGTCAHALCGDPSRRLIHTHYSAWAQNQGLTEGTLCPACAANWAQPYQVQAHGIGLGFVNVRTDQVDDGNENGIYADEAQAKRAAMLLLARSAAWLDGERRVAVMDRRSKVRVWEHTLSPQTA